MMLKSKCSTNLNSGTMQKESEKILSPQRFEPGSLIRKTDSLAKSAILPLYRNTFKTFFVVEIEACGNPKIPKTQFCQFFIQKKLMTWIVAHDDFYSRNCSPIDIASKIWYQSKFLFWYLILFMPFVKANLHFLFIISHNKYSRFKKYFFITFSPII
jgi:hypothetical protein